MPAALKTEGEDYLVSILKSSLLEGKQGGRDGGRKKGKGVLGFFFLVGCFVLVLRCKI